MSSSQQTDQGHLFKLLDGARQLLNRGEVRQAVPIFRALKEATSFSHAPYAWQQYAAALVQSGQIDQGITEFKQLIGSYTQKTLIRAHTLRLAAEAMLAAGKVEKVESYLTEALKIFDEQAEFYYVGNIKQLQAAMSATKSDFAQAAVDLNEGQTIVETYRIPASTDTRSMTSHGVLVGASA